MSYNSTSLERLTPVLGQEVAVYVREFASLTSADTRADVFIDGVYVGHSLLSPSAGPCCFAGIWSNDRLLKPFVFTRAKRNGMYLN